MTVIVKREIDHVREVLGSSPIAGSLAAEIAIDAGIFSEEGYQEFLNEEALHSPRVVHLGAASTAFAINRPAAVWFFDERQSN